MYANTRDSDERRRIQPPQPGGRDLRYGWIRLQVAREYQRKNRAWIYAAPVKPTEDRP